MVNRISERRTCGTSLGVCRDGRNNRNAISGLSLGAILQLTLRLVFAPSGTRTSLGAPESYC